MANTDVAYPVLGVYLILVLGAGLWAAVINFRKGALPQSDKVREHFLAGKGLGSFVWFWTMMATLVSGYSLPGIVNDVYYEGWMVTRWIPSGVGLCIAFAVIAPRLHALSKRRGYYTLSQVIFDRFSPPSSSHILVAHTLCLLSFFCLQLPVFTYLITQFKSLGVEVRTFTSGSITATTAICVAAAVLLICDLLGGMRAVAFTDVLQGIVLFVGSIIFLIIQKTELGGLDKAHDVWSYPDVPMWTGQFNYAPTKLGIVYYFDFVFTTTVAATMFPHLTARIFAARSGLVIRRGMSLMVFTLSVVQLSFIIIGWVAATATFYREIGQSAFGRLLEIVADRGTGQAVAAALLLASAICAMMSTADSALLAFSQMWVRDIYTKYLRPQAGAVEQLVFGKVMAVIGLGIGVGLGNYSAVEYRFGLSGLYALQTVTPIHVAPAIWLGLHWRSLRGEAVLIGLICGLGVALGLVFSDPYITNGDGGDFTHMGISASLFSFVVNIGLTTIFGLAMQYYPRRFGLLPLPPAPSEVEEVDGHEQAMEMYPAVSVTRTQVADVNTLAAAKGLEVRLPPSPSLTDTAAAGPTSPPPASLSRFRPRHLEIGTHRDRTLNPWLWTLMGLVLLFTTPFYRVPESPEGYVGAISSWAFTSLLLSGILAILGAYMFMFVWEDYKPVKEDMLPRGSSLALSATQPGPGVGGSSSLVVVAPVGAGAGDAGAVEAVRLPASTVDPAAVVQAPVAAEGSGAVGTAAGLPPVESYKGNTFDGTADGSPRLTCSAQVDSSPSRLAPNHES